MLNILNNVLTDPRVWLMTALTLCAAVLPESVMAEDILGLSESAGDARDTGRGLFVFASKGMAYVALTALVVILIFARDRTAWLGIATGVLAIAAFGGWGVEMLMGLGEDVQSG